MSKSKYHYYMNGIDYVVWLTDEEKWQFEVDHMMINLVPCI